MFSWKAQLFTSLQEQNHWRLINKNDGRSFTKQIIRLRLAALIIFGGLSAEAQGKEPPSPGKRETDGTGGSDQSSSR